MSRFNENAIQRMQEIFGRDGSVFFDFFSTWGGPTGWLLVVAIVFWFGGSKVGLRVGFSMCIAYVLNPLLKWSLAQPRPYYTSDAVQALKASDGFGMPSGHSQGVAAQWGATAVFQPGTWTAGLAAVFILCTGGARIYYGLHSPLQVVLGWGLGLVGVVAIVGLQMLAWWPSVTIPKTSRSR